jgi:periplasmic protein CpxP/Spy
MLMVFTNPRRSARRIFLLGVLPFLAITALVLPRAFAGRGWRGGCGHTALTPEEMSERMHDGAERLLDRVDATDAQRTAFAPIVDELVPDAVELQGEKLELAIQLQQALSAERVADAELERIRVSGIELAERASKRFTKALGQASEVLTAAQRQELAAEWQRWHE